MNEKNNPDLSSPKLPKAKAVATFWERNKVRLRNALIGLAGLLVVGGALGTLIYYAQKDGVEKRAACAAKSRTIENVIRVERMKEWTLVYHLESEVQVSETSFKGRWKYNIVLDVPPGKSSYVEIKTEWLSRRSRCRGKITLHQRKPKDLP